MNHDEIEEGHVAQRYVAGRLSADEEARFEEHYLHCRECQERLELAQSLDRGLKQVALEELMVPAMAAGAGRVARRRRLGARGWLLAAALAAALLPALWLAREVGRLGSALDGAEGTIAELQRHAEAPFEPLVVPLTVSRSAAGEASPDHRVTLSSERRWVLLTLALGGAEAGEYERFGVELFGPGGERRWQRTDLTADPHFEAVVVALPAAGLEAGDYRLRLEGVPAAGDADFLAEYGLRVVRADPEPRP